MIKNWIKKSFVLVLCTSIPIATFPAPTLAISQIPLTLVSPNRPQVLIAIGNSQSMDGNLSGAIMTGSGSLPSSASSLTNSSSPTSYLVPAGFTPPVQAANASGYAPYTAAISGILYDNSASRLNVAKAGVEAILDAYMASTDFGLMTYNTSSPGLYTTWVYYMSAGAGFTFTNLPNPNLNYVTNPCFGYLLASSDVRSNCASIASLYGSTTLNTNLYMLIGNTSDDPTINDVLYAGSSLPSVFVTYNGPSPSSPFPPYYSLSNYNNGSVSIRYSSTSPNIGSFSSSPTNAGFVPFSQQVMYAERGFGYYGSQSATSGTIVVPMTTLGNNPTATAVQQAINLFIAPLQPETNRLSTSEIKSVAVQSPTAGLLARALTYLTGLPDPSSGCPPQQYVILISDGLPTQDLSGKLWPPLGSASAAGYGVTATFDADGSLQSTNDQALTDTITSLKNLKASGIKTFVIGLGAGVDPTVNPEAAATLTAMAIAGGTVNYYPATNPTDLVNNLNNILVAIQNGAYTTSAAAVNTTSIQNTIVQVQASFVSSDTPYQDWTGNVTASLLDPNTGSPTSQVVWSAQPLLDNLVTGSGWSTKRLIATWNPTLLSNKGDGTPFQWANLSSAQKALLQPGDSLGASRVQYLRGNTALEVRNGGKFRNRSHILGDIINSGAIYVGAPSGPYLSTNSTYGSFVTTYKNRTPMVYVGSNDGMLHAFNANTGVEKFAFIPNAVIANLDNLTAVTYNQSHLYFVDGTPVAADVQFSNQTWHTLLVGSEGGGGNSIFALDITNPDNINSESTLATNVLWEFTDSDMGLSYSRPAIAPINPSSTTYQPFAVFFGNGYNSPNNNAVIYAVAPDTGTLLAKINLCSKFPSACSSTKVQGLSTVSVGVEDGIAGQAITVIYAGDLQGNMWAIDVSDSSPANWQARLLFQAKDSTGQTQPITTEPLVALQPLYPRLQGLFVMFGTGQLLTLNDLNSTQTQTVYGVWDQGLGSTYTRNNLQAQTFTFISSLTSGLGQDILLATSNAVNWGNNMGWFGDLVVKGQRVITDPALLNGTFIAILTTPPSNICTSPFGSMLLELDYRTGGAFSFPQIDLDGSSVINQNDKYGGSYPVGIGVLSGYVSSPTILGPNASGNIVKLLTSSTGNQAAVINPNTAPRVRSWWQIQ